MALWASEISLSSPVSLSESVSLVKDNFQTDGIYFKTEDSKMSQTQLVEIIRCIFKGTSKLIHFVMICRLIILRQYLRRVGDN